MHRRRLAILVLLVLAASPIAPRTSSPAAAASRHASSTHSVIASYAVRDESGCLTTSVFVSADAQSGNVPPLPDASPPGAQIALTRADTCQKRTLLAASGAVPFEGGNSTSRVTPRARASGW